MPKPFIEELQDFFHEYISSIDFNEISPQHKETADEIRKQCDLLKSLLSKEGQETLYNIDKTYGNLLTIELKLPIKKDSRKGLNYYFFTSNGGNP